MLRNIRKFFILAFTMLLVACSSMPLMEEKPTEKIYNVVFEGTPAIASGEVISGEIQIGEVLSQTQSNSGLTLAVISIEPEHQDLLKTNASFYAAGDKLYYSPLVDDGEPLTEGDKILGFNSKTHLYWYKTKASIGNTASEAMQKAKELFNTTESE